MRSLDLFPFAAIYVDNLEKTYMQSRDLSRFMWSEALSLLDQADRLHRRIVLLVVVTVADQSIRRDLDPSHGQLGDAALGDVHGDHAGDGAGD